MPSRQSKPKLDGESSTSASAAARIDETDQRIIAALRRRHRATVSDLSRYLGLARGTVHARLDRMETEGVIVGYGPELTLKTAGFPVRAFTTLTIAQGQHDDVVDRLAAIPNILEVHTVTGPGDLLVKIGARSNDDLHQLLQTISGMKEVAQVATQLALASPILRTAADLLVSTAPSSDG